MKKTVHLRKNGTINGTSCSWTYYFDSYPLPGKFLTDACFERALLNAISAKSAWWSVLSYATVLKSCKVLDKEQCCWLMLSALFTLLVFFLFYFSTSDTLFCLSNQTKKIFVYLFILIFHLNLFFYCYTASAQWSTPLVAVVEPFKLYNSYCKKLNSPPFKSSNHLFFFAPFIKYSLCGCEKNFS